jgi:hypothetical protein
MIGASTKGGIAMTSSLAQYEANLQNAHDDSIARIRAYHEAFLNSDVRRIEAISPWATPYCPECGELNPTDDNHLTFEGIVLIGCEGYFVINPNVLGITNTRWCDWL